MNSCATSGQVLTRRVSMKASTTTLPRNADSCVGCPFWSVSAKPGAGRAGTGESAIKLARLVGTLGGIPDGRSSASAAC